MRDDPSPLRLGASLSLLHFLFVQRVRGFGPPGQPSLDNESFHRFLSEVRASVNYLEFGSGGSTMVADRLRVPTLTVESDRFFAKAVRRNLRSGTTVEVVDIYLGITREWSEPIGKKITPKRKMRWSEYTNRPLEILRTRGIIPDFVLVDGRFRRSCILHVTQYVAESGGRTTIMVDDYYNPGREHYHMVEAFIGRPERVGRSAIFLVDGMRSPVRLDSEILTEAAADYR